MEGHHRDGSPGDGPSFKSWLHEWWKIKAPIAILQWIVNGVPLPLHNVPRLRVLRNHCLDDLQAVFVEDEILRLLRQGDICLLGCQEKGFFSPLGVVPKKNGKNRLIINMRLLNMSIIPLKFKYEDLSTLALLLCLGDFITMIDLKDGFFHVPVCCVHQWLMSFEWRGQTYCYQLLLFGLNASLWIFMRFVRMTIKHLRQLGVWTMAYMDDIIVLAPSYDNAVRDTNTTLQVLDSLSWKVNFKKSNLNPSQAKEFLGLVINTLSMPTFQVLLRKAHDLRHDIDRLLLVGQGVALTKAVLPAKLLLWNAYCDIAKRSSWASSILLSPGTISDLEEWLHGL